MPSTNNLPWMVSLHGGHSGAYCDHARGDLREFLEAAVARGLHTFGVTEHAPRVEARFLYPEEIDLGWDVAKIVKDFETYAQAVTTLTEEFADRLTVLRGFEVEVVPADRYVEIMLGYRERFSFDYIVGSVHWVDEVLIDGPKAEYRRAVDLCGGHEPLAVRYYETVAEMVRGLKPEVVGHLDLVRRNAPSEEAVATPAVRRAAEAALEVVREHDCIVDVNTAGYRNGLHRPYPAPWLVALGRRMGLGFCFGDDSHTPGHVGARLEDARTYLLQNGVSTITTLTRQEEAVRRKVVSLED